MLEFLFMLIDYRFETMEHNVDEDEEDDEVPG